MPMSGKGMLKLFLKAGWDQVKSHGNVKRKGSHAKVRKRSRSPVIPMHGELGRGLERKLLKELEEDEDEDEDEDEVK
jgi:predicted RNA binding protein YcfA (HicA-like mRNA interferase family)